MSERVSMGGSPLYPVLLVEEMRTFFFFFLGRRDKKGTK